MKSISDYIFHDGFYSKETIPRPNEEYLVQTDLDDLKAGDVVKFVGYQDVDNHYGIYVFTNADGGVLEVTGDFSGPDHPSMVNLKNALLRR